MHHQVEPRQPGHLGASLPLAGRRIDHRGAVYQLVAVLVVGLAVPGGVLLLDSGHVVIGYTEFGQRASSRVDNLLVDLFEP